MSTASAAASFVHGLLLVGGGCYPPSTVAWHRALDGRRPERALVKLNGEWRSGDGDAGFVGVLSSSRRSGRRSSTGPLPP